MAACTARHTHSLAHFPSSYLRVQDAWPRPSKTCSLSVTIPKFVSDDQQAKRYFVSGIVQGVGFRYFAQHAAEKLHVSGYVRNLHDGRVEVFAMGKPEQLANFRAALQRGPRFARVSDVREEAAAADPKYVNEFSITHDS